jgi:hypothetical protein
MIVTERFKSRYKSTLYRIELYYETHLFKKSVSQFRIGYGNVLRKLPPIRHFFSFCRCMHHLCHHDRVSILLFCLVEIFPCSLFRCLRDILLHSDNNIIINIQDGFRLIKGKKRHKDFRCQWVPCLSMHWI